MISEYQHFQEYKKIIGIDEAGRGPVAGPVVVAAVILPKDRMIEEINDSKKLSAKKRDELFKQITSQALHYEYKVIGHSIIDEINILQATFLGMNELLQPFLSSPHLALIDGPHLPKKEYDENCKLILKSVVSGDSTYQCIAAASIIAKVIRDSIMTNYHKKYPVYDFINNKGYLTRKHRAAIEKHGICPIHRRSFSPVKEIHNSL